MDQQQPTSSNSSSSPSSPQHHSNVHRQILRQCVAAICHSSGFHSAQAGALDALTAVAHRMLTSTCQSSRALCEHTGRSLVNPGDVYMALLNGGQPDLDNFGNFLRSLRRRKTHNFTLQSQSPPQVPPVLRIADPRPHPTHFPSFLPPFPDPHTYIRTEIRDEVDTNYERARRLDAQNRRDWERSLVHYSLAHYPSVSVFRELEAKLAFEAKDAIEQQRAERRRRRLKQQSASGLPTLAGDNGGGGQQRRVLGAESAAAINGGDGSESMDEALPAPMEEENELPAATTATERSDDGDNGKLATGGGTATAGAATLEKEQNTTNNGVDAAVDPLFEELFDPVDTERSYVLKRIPHHCHILLPFEEPRPYLSALLTTEDLDVADGAAGTDDDYFARILSKEMMMMDQEDSSQME